MGQRRSVRLADAQRTIAQTHDCLGVDAAEVRQQAFAVAIERGLGGRRCAKLVVLPVTASARFNELNEMDCLSFFPVARESILMMLNEQPREKEEKARKSALQTAIAQYQPPESKAPAT